MKKDKSVSLLIRIFSLIILFGMVVWTIGRTGMISLIGTEDIYWERARFLLGQGGVSLYSGSSICSLGYSLILLPICSLIKSPYAAYKAAVLLNGFFLCAGYLAATAAALKLFPKERESFLDISCFFAVFTPALMISKTYTGPELAVLFLTWVSIYLLASLWKEARTGRLVLLAVCLIVIGFLQVTALGVVLAVTILLGFYVKERRLEGSTFLFFALAVLLGLAAGNIAERIVLSAFAEGRDITSVQSSLEVLINGMLSVPETGFFSGLLAVLSGKLYNVLVSSFLLACPALWYFGKTILLRKKKRIQKSLPVLGVSGIFVVQFFWISLYDRSLGIARGMFSLSGLEMVLPPLILVGIVEIKRSRSWQRQLPGYLILLCVCTFVAAVNMQTGNRTISAMQGASNGFLMLFGGLSGSVKPAAIYTAACVVMLTALVLAFLFLALPRGLKFGSGLKLAGCAGVFLLLSGMNVLMVQQTADELTADHLETVAPIASVLPGSETEYNCVFYNSSGVTQRIVMLQSLLPDTEIQLVDDTDKDWLQTKDLIILTGASKNTIQEKYEAELEGFHISYMTGVFAVWTRDGSTLQTEVEDSAEQRIELLTKVSEEEETETETETETESETGTETETETEPNIVILNEEEDSAVIQTFGEGHSLAAGTYRLYINFHAERTGTGTGTVTISDDSGTLCSSSFDSQIFDENGNGMVSVEFTGRTPMWNVQVQVEGTILSYADIQQMYYRKTTSSFTVDLNDFQAVTEAADAILTVDAACGSAGTVAYVDASASDTENLSMRIFEECLTDYEIEAVSEDDLETLQSDYLIGQTAAHAFYAAMDRYSVISWGDTYTVLVRNNSKRCRIYKKLNGNLLSSGKTVRIRAFVGKNKPVSPFALDSGDYIFHVRLRYDSETFSGDDDETACILYIKNGKKILAEREVTYAELRSSPGELEVEIPLNLSSGKRKVKCRVENYTSVKIKPKPTGIELVSENYQYGKEETELNSLLSWLKTLKRGTMISVVQPEAEDSGSRVSYTWLEEQISWCEVEEISADAACQKGGDGVLLTYGLKQQYLNLLSQYSIIGHAGKYTLWARTDGEYMNLMLSAGAGMLSSGGKLTLESLAAMKGKENNDGVISSLPAGSYIIHVKLTAKDLDPDDTIEVTLYRDKTEKEIAEELEQLMEDGYTEDEAQELIDPQISCGSTKRTAYQFGEADDLIVKITKTGSDKVNNLCCEAYTWKNGDVKAEIEWVEIN